MPAISGPSISPSGLLDTCMTAFPLMRQRENRWKSCLVTIPSSSPDCLAKADASRLSCVTATLCKPPRVSAAIGKNEIPCSWQAAAAPCTFLSKADFRFSHKVARDTICLCTIFKKNMGMIFTVMS